MTKDEALHKALKVLNCLNNDRVYETAWVKGAINACEEALAHPTQEPVAYFKKWEDKSGEHKDIKFSNSEGYKPLYTQPAPRPTQEPVLYIDEGGLDGHATWAQATRCQATDIALYTHPKEWQGLSDDEIWDIANFLGKNKEWDYPVMVATTIEKALKEQNT